MVRRILFVLVLAMGFLYASNTANVGYMKKTAGNNYSSTIVDTSNKKIFFTYLLLNSVSSINNETLNAAKRQITNIVCEIPKFRSLMINEGYEVIVTYIYSNNIIIHVVINSCSL